MSAAPSGSEVVALCRAQLAALMGGQSDPFGAVWDSEMTPEERHFWTRAAGLKQWALSYMTRTWAEIGASNRVVIKLALRRAAARAKALGVE